MEFFLEISPGTKAWIIVVCGTLALALGTYLLKLLAIRWLRASVAKTRYKFDSIFVNAASPVFSILAVVATIAGAERLLRFTEILGPGSSRLSGTLIQVLSIVAILIFIDRLVYGFVGGYADRSDTIRNSRSIIQGVSRGLILSIGMLVLLGTLGISITPIIASLGITSLAVALALQPTLENFFSGTQLVMDKPIRVGDFIELESGEQGFVEKIGWRSTWIKMLQNNTIIMPNSTMANSKIINYFYPEKELSVPVEVGVHYNSDLEHVERVTLEVARETLVAHEWGVDDYNTFVVYTGFGDSSINFTVMLRAKEYFNRFWVRSHFIKALHRRYAEEGINIPYPIRAINTSQESPVLPIIRPDA
jgi:small-conductance mechanosensitive channel